MANYIHHIMYHHGMAFVSEHIYWLDPISGAFNGLIKYPIIVVLPIAVSHEIPSYYNWSNLDQKSAFDDYYLLSTKNPQEL